MPALRRWIADQPLAVIKAVAYPALISIVSLVSLLGGWLWPLDLLSHYRLQYAALLVPVLGLALYARSSRAAAWVTVVLVAHVVPLLPLVLPADQPGGDGTSLRVVQINVLTQNDRIADTAEWLTSQEPDVIVAQETDQAWADGLDAGLDGWRRLPTDSIRNDDNFGMAVYVADDIDVEGAELHEPAGVPAIAVTVAIEDGPPAMVYALHTLPPVRGVAVDIADVQIDHAISVLDDHAGPRLVVGDLNTTRWGAAYRRLMHGVDLRDSADGRGLMGTWPQGLGFTGRIGIDHVLVSDEIRVDDRWRGPDLGSDHLAVVADLTVVTEPSVD